jgi:rSAM/selenodomain-associated transferase 1
VKLPVKGNVKTRLAETIGDAAALALYRCFVSDTLAAVRRTGYPTLVFFHPPDAQRAVTDWLGDDITFLPQEGADLGERMSAAFQKAFLRCPRAVLVGSDIPDLPPASLHEAFEVLKTRDAVIGPARDGGYYLIGFSSAGIVPAAFEGIEWGGPRVFEETLAILRKHGLNVHVLPTWDDIDDCHDLKALCDRQKGLPRGRLSTIDFLRDHFRW